MSLHCCSVVYCQFQSLAEPAKYFIQLTVFLHCIVVPIGNIEFRQKLQNNSCNIGLNLTVLNRLRPERREFPALFCSTAQHNDAITYHPMSFISLALERATMPPPAGRISNFKKKRKRKTQNETIIRRNEIVYTKPGQQNTLDLHSASLSHSASAFLPALPPRPCGNTGSGSRL